VTGSHTVDVDNVIVIGESGADMWAKDLIKELSRWVYRGYSIGRPSHNDIALPIVGGGGYGEPRQPQPLPIHPENTPFFRTLIGVAAVAAVAALSCNNQPEAVLLLQVKGSETRKTSVSAGLKMQ
jgi:hypothetical protein